MLNIEKIAKNIKLTEEKESRYTAKYTLEPLYRGYGNTIGNALRRILLSSIPGSAIKGLRIDGVLNEFSTIPGVKEAVTDIILNVKEIVVELDEPGEKKMVLSVKGPKVITAADIKPDPGIKIINPEQVIATVTTDKEINMEFLVDSGEGFVVSDEIDTEGWPIGYLAVDAIYTPIKRVTYSVEDTMVGRVTNYDKLILEISTDGSIEIHDALSYAVELLILHVKPFTNIGNSMSKFRGNEDENSSLNSETESNIEDMKIEELDFTVRSYNCLKKAGVNTISDLTSMTYVELLKIKNLGRKSLNEIIDKMKELGYDLSEEAGN
ncbi:DNA-directed RNA polymerase subunit alpha [Pseudoleptotrichia goodfellowii]|uniref:DNA-directed RNA polymerase subunit alpha n=2 Tax=Pseudoleptotrichia goodfellowii TaxID=157692 RepID=D0GME6_9FUSO|nr:DNA-directed RNA polymerase subunit alpha [Pseudoleptotrichia goodfellowii]EEY34729.1 DNA-directed RNA polymerase, alpha subunit [Pseudoleptotrichia goodfellowii F0264]MBF4805066.1 DNA-directed RNA polymerase subunit alpha [Pseudoleptotrichia goodfellowii]BBM37070.1 DNA-directed RNA polymerase subunit alpha [Pseudoleptotrichia goodfellowii]